MMFNYAQGIHTHSILLLIALIITYIIITTYSKHFFTISA